MANGENPQIVRAMLRWTYLNMLAHYAHGFKSDKLEAQGAVLDRLVKSGVKSGVWEPVSGDFVDRELVYNDELTALSGRLTQR